VHSVVSRLELCTRARSVASFCAPDVKFVICCRMGHREIEAIIEDHGRGVNSQTTCLRPLVVCTFVSVNPNHSKLSYHHSRLSGAALTTRHIAVTQRTSFSQMSSLRLKKSLLCLTKSTNICVSERKQNMRLGLRRLVDTTASSDLTAMRSPRHKDDSDATNVCVAAQTESSWRRGCERQHGQKFDSTIYF
jgi:hypothetical protein